MDRPTLSSQLGLPISQGAYERLSLLVTLLLQWNRSINLIGKGTEKDIWTRHILDSLQLLHHLPNSSPLSLLDVGSGGGLPGMVLALCHPGEFILVESDRRKSLFLSTVSRETQSLYASDETPSTISILNTRIESLPPSTPDIITARAFATIDTTLSLVRQHIGPNTICLFPKGVKYSSDVEEARRNWKCDVSTHPSLSHDSGTLVKISNITAS